MPILVKVKGMTLIELLLAVAIVGILAGVAYPSYTEFVTRSDRTEGQRELIRIANLQEQFYIDNRAYTEDMTDLGLTADPHLSENGYYSIDATVVDDSFTLTATAKSKQTKDTGCTSMTISETGQRTPSSGCWDK